MPKKKKKGIEKEKKAKKKSFINERETLSFEQQILDNNRQLARYEDNTVGYMNKNNKIINNIKI